MWVDLASVKKGAGKISESVFRKTKQEPERKWRKGAMAQKMTAEERDTLRAALIRAKLKKVPEPDIAKIVAPASGSPENDE